MQIDAQSEILCAEFKKKCLWWSWIRPKSIKAFKFFEIFK